VAMHQELGSKLVIRVIDKE